MFGIAVGHCGLSISEFYAAELGEVLCVVRSFYQLQEQRERTEWERTRFIAYVVAKTHDSKRRIKKPSDILPFPWEKLEKEIDHKSFLKKAEAKAAETQRKWLESLKEKGLLNVVN